MNISCHHGASDNFNVIEPALRVLDAHPEVDTIEIDVVYFNNQFVTAHDAADAKKATKSGTPPPLLSQWRVFYLYCIFGVRELLQLCLAAVIVACVERTAVPVARLA